MNRTSFTCVAISVFFLGATAAEAVPIRYSVDWVAGRFEFGDPLGLAGAHIHFEAQWDPATLTPTIGTGYPTSWRFSQVSQITVTGSSHADGTWTGYSGGWEFLNDEEGGFMNGDLSIDSPVDVVLGGHSKLGLQDIQWNFPTS